jgi:hypothetical protein
MDFLVRGLLGLIANDFGGACGNSFLQCMMWLPCKNAMAQMGTSWS